MIILLHCAFGHAIIQLGKMATCKAEKKNTQPLGEARKRSRGVSTIRSFTRSIRNNPLFSQQAWQSPLADSTVIPFFIPLNQFNASGSAQPLVGTGDHRPGVYSALGQSGFRASDGRKARYVSHERTEIDASWRSGQALSARSCHKKGVKEGGIIVNLM